MAGSKKAAGLTVCALIAAWVALTGLSGRIDDMASEADQRVSDVEYSSSRLDSRIGDLEEQLGNPGYGSSQSSRLEDLEGRTRNAEERTNELERKVHDMESQRSYGY